MTLRVLPLLVLLVLLANVVLAEDNSVSAPENVWSADERREFYHLPEGSEIFPLRWLRAIHSTRTKQPFMENLERFGLLPDPQNPDGLPVGITATVSRDLRFARLKMVGVNCAACHTGEIEYRGRRLRIDGAPGQFDVEGFFEELEESVARTFKNPAELVRFMRRLSKLPKDEHDARGAVEFHAPPDVPADESRAGADAAPHDDPGEVEYDGQYRAADAKRRTAFGSGVLWKEEVASLLKKGDQKLDPLRLIGNRVDFIRALNRSRKDGGTRGGFGRTDALGRLRYVLFGKKNALPTTASVDFPQLWGITGREWLHWDGNTNSALERNIGQAIGLGAAFSDHNFESTVRILDLHKLEALAAKLKAPRWPADIFGALDDTRSARGETLFAANCAGCHGVAGVPARSELFSPAVIGTDPNRLRNFQVDVNGRSYAAAIAAVIASVKAKAWRVENIGAVTARELEGVAEVQWRRTDGYLARPLQGIWATAPYLHNGSVPTLDDLLRPAAARPKRFHTGHRAYDPAKVGFAADAAAHRGVFDVSEPGNSNAGHEFGAALSEEERLDLLEYLKTL